MPDYLNPNSFPIRESPRGITELYTSEDVRAVVGAWRPAQVTIILYGAKWCRSCKMLKPRMDRLANKVGPLAVFYQVNHHENTQHAFNDAQVITMPTLMIYDGAYTKMLPANKDTLLWLERAIFNDALWVDEYQP